MIIIGCGSDENKKIADEMIKNGIIDNIENNEGRGNGLTVSLRVPINSDSLVGDVSDKLLQLASMFQQQDVLYGRKTIDEIKSSVFKELDDGNYRNIWTHEIMTKEEIQQSLPEWVGHECKSMYTSDGINYFISEDLLNKHLSYMDTLETHKAK